MQISSIYRIGDTIISGISELISKLISDLTDRLKYGLSLSYRVFIFSDLSIGYKDMECSMLPFHQ